MTTKLVILVEHFLPQILADRPACAGRLSGAERAHALVETFSTDRSAIRVSNVEAQACETAGSLAGNLGLEFQVIDGPRPHDRSHAPDHSKEKFQNLVQEFFETPADLVFGSETANQALERFKRAVDSGLDSDRHRCLPRNRHFFIGFVANPL